MSTTAATPAQSSRPPQKRRKFNNHEHSAKLTTSTNQGTSTATLKKKVRDLERLLAHQTNLPADVRLDHERALEAFKYELNLAKKSARDEKIDKKYQMVRFFERQKATRKLKQLQKQVSAESSPSEVLKNDLHAAEVDLNYILYYPKGEKYISLFKDPGEHTKVLEKRDMFKRDIERRMERGTLGSGVVEEGEDEEVHAEKGEKDGKKKKDKESSRDKKKRKKDVEEAPVEEEDGFFEF